MTAKQMKTFWPAFNSACRELGLVDKSAREEYRHEVMWETAHARHLSEVTATTGVRGRDDAPPRRRRRHRGREPHGHR